MVEQGTSPGEERSDAQQVRRVTAILLYIGLAIAVMGIVAALVVEWWLIFLSLIGLFDAGFALVLRSRALARGASSPNPYARED